MEKNPLSIVDSTVYNRIILAVRCTTVNSPSLFWFVLRQEDPLLADLTMVIISHQIRSKPSTTVIVVKLQRWTELSTRLVTDLPIEVTVAGAVEEEEAVTTKIAAAVEVVVGGMAAAGGTIAVISPTTTIEEEAAEVLVLLEIALLRTKRLRSILRLPSSDNCPPWSREWVNSRIHRNTRKK